MTQADSIRTNSIVVVDDEKKHLDSLTKELAEFGTPYLPLHFTGEPFDVPACPDVRLIFVDLHLIGGMGGDHRKDFSVIGNLIEETIKPVGPYLMVLWTLYPDQASALKVFLERLLDATEPVDILPLPKIEYLDGDGDVKDRAALRNAIDSLTRGWLSPRGTSHLRGAWGSLDDREVDAFIEEIHAARRRDTGRNVELED